MPPPMMSVSTLGSSFSITSILPADLGAADDRHERPLRVVDGVAEEVELLLHQVAGGALRRALMPVIELCARCAVPKASLT